MRAAHHHLRHMLRFLINGGGPEHCSLRRNLRQQDINRACLGQLAIQFIQSFGILQGKEKTYMIVQLWLIQNRLNHLSYLQEYGMKEICQINCSWS